MEINVIILVIELFVKEKKRTLIITKYFNNKYTNLIPKKYYKNTKLKENLLDNKNNLLFLDKRE